MSNITRESFNTYLFGVIFPCLSSADDIDKTKIIFPRTLSKLERYNIHKLNNNDFRTASYDNQQEDRIIEVILSKKYVQDLFRGHGFNQPTSQKTEKQMLFDTLIGFIESSLGTEFKDYLNTI